MFYIVYSFEFLALEPLTCVFEMYAYSSPLNVRLLYTQCPSSIGHADSIQLAFIGCGPLGLASPDFV